MAGSKTRFGFLGSGEEPPDSDGHGAARTVIGHDIHLQKLPSGFAPPGPLGSPTPIPAVRVPITPQLPSAVIAPMTEEITESIPVRRAYRPRKSRLARFLGRWANGGHFHSRSRMNDATRLDDPVDDDLELPCDTTGRNVLLVVVIAGLTFLVTFAVVRTRQRHAVVPPVPGTPATKILASPPPLPQRPAPIVPSPVHAATPAASEQPVLLGTPPAAGPPEGQPHLLTGPASTSRPANVPDRPASSTSKHPPHPHKAAQAASPAFDLPEHLRGELLPLGK